MMKHRSKLLAITLAVLTTMTIGASVSAALRSLEVSATQLRTTEKALTFFGGGIETICEVTLNKTLDTRAAKVRAASMGSVEARAATERCRGGRLRFLAETLPWRVNFVAFTGTLPSIREVREEIVGFALLLSSFGGLGECLYRGSLQLTTGPNAEARELTVNSTISVPLARNLGGLFCPEELGFRGAFAYERTVRLRLV